MNRLRQGRGARKVRVLFASMMAAIVLLSGGLLAGHVAAQAEIPEGAAIESATLWLYATNVSGQTVNVHRITAGWDETSVTWNSFGGSYAPEVVGSLVVSAMGWQSVDVTALVQGWADGTYPNYGVLLEQGQTSTTAYHSSEYSVDPTLRPKLDICYSFEGQSECLTIQRSEMGQAEVADAYVWELNPDDAYNWERLYTGLVSDYEKQSLVRFDFTSVPGVCVGTGTPGYWKTHPCAWPVDEITIGGETYPKLVAIAKMWLPGKWNKADDMFKQLVAAKLNVEIGNESGCIEETITAADAWMEEYGGTLVRARSEAWKSGEPLFEKLDDYNNGLLCASSRDLCEGDTGCGLIGKLKNWCRGNGNAFGNSDHGGGGLFSGLGKKLRF